MQADRERRLHGSDVHFFDIRASGRQFAQRQDPVFAEPAKGC
jgi:hypothetical protein